ncbi:MAG: carboxypeptidase regulatory-like domain-containing protein [Candidatus Sericytochromatia bacterium]|nr:carboxypeptidase regulatory-like domain-containing protein [Candidatus Sericytochromatia bacterium]
MMPVIKPLQTLLALAVSLSLLACETPTVPGEPAGSPTPDSGSTPSVAPAVPVPQVDVQVLVQDAVNQSVNDARVSLSSSNSPTQVARTGSDGRVRFDGLRQDTTYTLSVEANGYVSASRQANLSQLATLGQRELVLGIILQPIGTSIQGRVQDAAGQPIEHAAVFDGQQTVLSDAEGRFVLAYQQAQNLQLSVSRTGYQTLSQPLDVALNDSRDLGNLSLQASSQSLRVGLDSRSQPFGRSGDSAFSDYQGLQQLIRDQGHSLSVSDNLLQALSQLDVLIMLSPSASLSVEDSSAIQAFVRQGGKLILSGEWSGFGGFSVSSANQLLLPFQLRFGQDTLRQGASGFFNASPVAEHPISRGLSQLRVYQTGSVEVLSSTGPAQILARSPADSFRILNNTGAFGLAAATAFGTGRVIVLGDSSLWSDADSDGDGSSNLSSADNRRLLEQILRW